MTLYCRADCNIHTRQPGPRQKRFRTEGGRGDGALRIGALLIASKVPLGIRFSAGARTTPKSFHRGGFWCNLLSEQKVTDKTIMEDCDSPESRGPQPRPAEARNRSRMLTRALRRLLPEQPQPPKINFTRNRRRRTAGRYKKTFAMPILASRLGGMTLHIAVRRTVRAAASRSGGPLSFANAHSRSPQAATRKRLISFFHFSPRQFEQARLHSV